VRPPEDGAATSRPPASSRRGRAAVLGFSTVTLAFLLTALPWSMAQAHGVLLDSSPTANAVLTEGPREVVLRFNEPVRPVVVRLLRASDQARIELGSPEVTDTELHIPLPTGLIDGSYVLSYRVTSADGHPVVGSFVFAIGAPGARGTLIAAAAGGREEFWSAAGVAARALWYGGLLLAAGLALFLALLPVPTDLQPPLRRALAWLAVLALATVW
jgi:copper transport protein